MADASDGWKIGDLADLILGRAPGAAAPRTPPGAAARPPGSAPSGEPLPASPAGRAEYKPRHAVLVLVNAQQDACEAVSRYADYWSDRGENVGVLWIGQSGIKVGLFDCARRSGWSEEVMHVLSRGPVEAVPALIRQFCDRLVLALVTSPGWTRSPLIEAVASVCVIVEPAPCQLVGSYDALKSLCRLSDRHALSCFAINAQSALEATRLGDRFYRLGDEFLNRAIALEGFSLAEKWPTTNRVAEAYVAEKPDGRAARLREALLAVLRGEHAAPGAPPETGADICAGAEAPDGESPFSPERRNGAPGNGALPVVQALRTEQPIEDAAGLDLFISEKIDEVVPGVLRTWPLRPLGDGLTRCRWVELEGGGRCVVASTLSSACGALEQASAWLHPVRPEDHIIVLAPHLSSEQRRAAEVLPMNTRLFELARLADALTPPALLLREVSGCGG